MRVWMSRACKPPGHSSMQAGSEVVGSIGRRVRCREPDVSTRAAESGIRQGTCDWTRIPALKASIPLVEFGRGGDGGPRRGRACARRLKFGCRVAAASNFSPSLSLGGARMAKYPSDGEFKGMTPCNPLQGMHPCNKPFNGPVNHYRSKPL